jgi:hypothetical protein|tara:strand:- start:1129 stop:1554 length:426 start_codon:yes stop_codon:yes gene_type:complete
MSDNKLPIEQITKLANDVRLIQNFTENHNFDNSLLEANISPPASSKKYDKPLIVMIASMLLVLSSAAVILLWEPPLTSSMSSLVFLVGLLFAISATMSAHLKFKDNVITGAVAIGLLMLLSIGAGIFTAEEALSRAGELAG